MDISTPVSSSTLASHANAKTLCPPLSATILLNAENLHKSHSTTTCTLLHRAVDGQFQKLSLAGIRSSIEC